MEESIGILLKAIIGGGGVLICFLAGYWFNKINNRQDAAEKELKDHAISRATSGVKIVNIDEDINVLRLNNENLAIEFRKESIGLAKEMKAMVKSITIVHQKTEIHDVEIANMKDRIIFIADELKKNR